VINIIVALSGNEKISKLIAKKAKQPYTKLVLNKFPDGEIDIRFNKRITNKKIFLVQSFQNTNNLTLNDKIIETLFAIYTAKNLNAKKIYLIAPYFPYFRSDKRFKQGESVGINIMNQLFSVCDKIFCIDPHLHRIKNIKNALENGTNISLDKPIIDYLKSQNIKNPLFVGPDKESLQWVINVASAFNKKPVIALKKRESSRKVKIKLPSKVNAKDKELIIIDDIISTGNTMLENIKELKKYKPKKIYLIGIHGIFAENALEKLKKHGIIVSTNTLVNDADIIDVSDEIVKKIKRYIK